MTAANGILPGAGTLAGTPGSMQTPPSSSAASIAMLPLASLAPSGSNPRRSMDAERLAELADFVPGNKSGFLWR